jgi:hypothetical protein
LALLISPITPAYLQRNCWPATPRFRSIANESEAGAMPFDYGLRLDNRQRIANAKPIEAKQKSIGRWG